MEGERTGTSPGDLSPHVCRHLIIKTFREFGEEDQTCEKITYIRTANHSPSRSLKGTRSYKVVTFEGLLLSDSRY